MDDKKEKALTSLLSDPLPSKNIDELNENGLRTLHALLCAYAKHHCGSDDIGWGELSNILLDAICEEIRDDRYHEWINLF